MIKKIGAFAGVAIAYWLAARLGLFLASAHASISPVWPPTGVALAAVLLLGYRIWPAIALASFIANLETGVPIATAVGIGTGNTLEAVSGAFLLFRFVRGINCLDRPWDVVKFILLAPVISTMVSATIGTGSLYFSGLLDRTSYSYLWYTWWLGDAVGSLIIFPFLLFWLRQSDRSWRLTQLFEAIFLIAVAIGIGTIVFSGFSTGAPLAYLSIPIIVWATLRFAQRGASTTVLLLSAFATWGTHMGYAPFPGDDLNESLLQLQLFVAVIASMALVLAAALRSAEIRFRGLAENIPAVIYTSDFGPRGRCRYISPKIKSLIGFTHHEWLADPGLWMKQIHPEDREMVMQQESITKDSGDPFRLEYRMFTRGGRLIWVRDEGLVLKEGDPPRSYQGILLDVTKRKRAEQALNESKERYEALVNSVDGIVWEADTQMAQFTFVSRQAEQLLGYPLQQWIEPAFWEKHIYSEDREAVVLSRANALQLEKGHRHEYRMMSATGRPVWVNDLVSVIAGSEGPIKLRGVMVDITEKKEAEKLQSALYDISRLASSTLDIQGFYGAIHRILGELMSTKNFYIALYDETTGRVRFPYYIDEVDRGPWKDVDPGLGLTSYVIRTGEPLLLSSERLEEMILEGKVELHGANPVDWLGVPLKSGHKTIGVVAIQSYTSEVRIQEREKEVLTFVSHQIAAVMERKHAEEVLRESETRYRSFFEEDLTGDFVMNPDGRLMNCNPAFARIFGFVSVEEAMSCAIADLFPNPDSWKHLLDMLREQKKLEYFEIELLRKDREKVYVIGNIIGVFDPQAMLTHIKGYFFDNTAQKKLEEQLRQAQKIRAIGQLAGGVAHDFNNLLMTITSYAELLLMRLPPDSPYHGNVHEIQKAAEKGASLTRQLLAFGRKQVLAPEVLNLNVVVRRMKDLVGRLIGSDIELSNDLSEDLGLIRVDPTQVEQIIMNLSVNARDAMKRGGQLSFETRNVLLDSNYVRSHVGALPGDYVMLVVKDTGSGMDSSTVSHLFEPFFTTKEDSTGLGLSSVYGIIKQSGGYITVESEPGSGTTFKIYFPRTDRPSSPEAHPEEPRPVTSGPETILLVDDNDSVRSAIGLFLQMRGYHVLQAGNGKEAMEVSRKHDGVVDLLVTDMVMPKMSGRELSQQLITERPGTKVLILSGFSEDVMDHDKSLPRGFAFLQKPAPMDTLIKKIRELLSSHQV